MGTPTAPRSANRVHPLIWAAIGIWLGLVDGTAALLEAPSWAASWSYRAVSLTLTTLFDAANFVVVALVIALLALLLARAVRLDIRRTHVTLAALCCAVPFALMIVEEREARATSSAVLNAAEQQLEVPEEELDLLRQLRYLK